MLKKRERENPVFYGWVVKAKDKLSENSELQEIRQYSEDTAPLSFIKDLNDKEVKEVYMVPRTGKGPVVGLDVKSNMKSFCSQHGYHENFSSLPEIHVAVIGFQYSEGILGSEDIIAYSNKLTHACRVFAYPNGSIEFGADSPSFNKQYQVKRGSISGGVYDYRFCVGN